MIKERYKQIIIKNIDKIYKKPDDCCVHFLSSINNDLHWALSFSAPFHGATPINIQLNRLNILPRKIDFP